MHLLFLLLVAASALDVCLSTHVHKSKSRTQNRHSSRSDTSSESGHQNYQEADFLNLLKHKNSESLNESDDLHVNLDDIDNSKLSEENINKMHQQLHVMHKKLKGTGAVSKSKVTKRERSVLEMAREKINQLLQDADLLPKVIQILRSSIKKMQAYSLLIIKKLSSVADGLSWDNRHNHELATYIEIINSIVVNMAVIDKRNLEVPAQAFNNASNAGYAAAMGNYAGNATEKVDRTFYDVATLLSKLQPFHDFIEIIPSNCTAEECLSYTMSFLERYKQADLMVLGHMVALDLIDFIAEEVAQDLMENVGDMGAGRYIVLRKSQSEGVIIKVLLLGLVMEDVDDISTE